jgi:tetratricopeptide (TPR) repeat protein
MTDIAEIKAACGLITTGTSKGTGYLVSQDRVITCAHVVEGMNTGDNAKFSLDGVQYDVTVAQVDSVSDCALLGLAQPPDKVSPLPLGKVPKWKAPWDGYGYPGAGKGAGLPLEGVVMDPTGRDDQKINVLILASPQVAAGMAAPLHGFSGSPVVVEGAVVGHIKRFVQDPDNPLRPAYGLVYATPSSAILKLTGLSVAVPLVEPPRPLFPTTDLPILGKGEYHVFVSYRSTDRVWAKDLVTRLEGVGFKAFIDDKELVPGTRLAHTLQDALSKSKAAVVLMSQGWLESPWCQEESNVLLHRLIEDPNFRVIPIRIDDCSPPVMWQSRLWLDFSGMKGPEGPQLMRLQYALLGKTLPDLGSQENRVFKAETEATDALIREVRAAKSSGPERVVALWEKWQSSGMPTGPAALCAAQSLIELGSPQDALKVLAVAQEGVRADQLRALALDKAGKTDEAIQILETLYSSGHLDAETGGLLAGRYKKRWKNSGYNDRGSLLKACDLYKTTFERTGDSYPGINAASTALWLGNRAEAKEIAQKVLSAMDRLREDLLDQWNLATRGEAYLLVGDLENAKRWYGKAVARSPESHQNIAVMRWEARFDLKELREHPPNTLDSVLYIPGVAAFTGHMTDAPGRASPRFPQEKVGAVRMAIRERLQASKVMYGYSSAARGSDLIFLEELLRLGGSAHVFLPFSPQDFAQTSVGHGWDAIFNNVLKDPKVQVSQLSDRLPPTEQQPQAYSDCTSKVFEEARKQASLLDQNPLLMTVWNGNPGDGRGGTADAVRNWKSQGNPVEVIDISNL